MKWMRFAMIAYRMCMVCVIAALLFTSFSGFHISAQSGFDGQWMIDSKRSTNRIHLTLNYSDDKSGRGYNNTSFNIDPAELRGLTQPQMMSSGGQVQFQIVRDAGTLNCEGWFKDGRGSGHFVFSANPAFAGELKRRGYASPDESQQFSLAIHNVGLAYIDELRAQGYEQPTLDQLVRMGRHGVSMEYVRDLKAAGYDLRSTDMLTRMVDHGVSIKFIRELDGLGYKKLPAETLVRTVDHGVSPDFIRELQALGYNDLPLEQLVRVVDHGVSAKFIQEVEAAGYGHLSLEQLVRMQDHGVSVGFIKEIGRAHV